MFLFSTAMLIVLYCFDRWGSAQSCVSPVHSVTDSLVLFGQVEFSEMLLPYLVHEILLPGHAELREVLSRRISGFFHTHCDLTASNTAKTAAGKLLLFPCTS